MQHRYLRIEKLSAETGISVRTLRSLYKTKRISHIKAGHRTILFNPNKVQQELEKLEISAVS
jgi:hypothetical protein